MVPSGELVRIMAEGKCCFEPWVLGQGSLPNQSCQVIICRECFGGSFTVLGCSLSPEFFRRRSEESEWVYGLLLLVPSLSRFGTPDPGWKGVGPTPPLLRPFSFVRLIADPPCSPGMDKRAKGRSSKKKKKTTGNGNERCSISAVCWPHKNLPHL